MSWREDVLMIWQASLLLVRAPFINVLIIWSLMQTVINAKNKKAHIYLYLTHGSGSHINTGLMSIAPLSHHVIFGLSLPALSPRYFIMFGEF